MDAATLYEEDFHAWSEHQAALLRGLTRRPLALPNDLDLEHVAEEIEDLGIAQRAAVKDLLLQLFIHLVKLFAHPGATAAAHWAREADTFRDQAANRYTRSMRQRIDLDALWRRAVERVAGELAREGSGGAARTAVAALARTRCPFEIEAVLEETPRTEELVRTIQDMAGRDDAGADR